MINSPSNASLFWRVLAGSGQLLLAVFLGATIIAKLNQVSRISAISSLLALYRRAFRGQGLIARGWYLYALFVMVICVWAMNGVISLLSNHSLSQPVLSLEWPHISLSQSGLSKQFLRVLPFSWIVTGLCIMRLKDAGLSPFFAILLAIPPVNFLLLGILTAIPSHESEESDTALVRDNSILSRLIPESSLGVAVCAATVSSGIAVLGVLLGAYGLGNFGSPLFLGLPFYGGFISAVIYGAEKRRTVKECLGVAFLSLIITATALVCFLIEGIICIAVLLPLAGVFSLIGALFGYSVQFIRQKRSGRIESSLLCGVIVTLSLAIPVPDSPVLKTVSHITIDRPPRDVWPHIIAFSEIEKPKEWLFLRGVAYPIRARIEGYGVGAVRYCEFSTGPFVEPITVWNEPHELRFTVTQTPPALTEYNPLGTVISPHLDGYFESLGGQFLLTEPSHGVTEIQATTWYRHRVSPVWYWQMISNPILHMIHGRVLEHIKMKAEVRM